MKSCSCKWCKNFDRTVIALNITGIVIVIGAVIMGETLR